MSTNGASVRCREFYEAVVDSKEPISVNTRQSAYYSLHLMQEWREIAKNIRGVGGTRILDIGCGPAYILDIISNWQGVDYVGLDIALKAIPKMKHKEIAQFALGDAVCLPFTSGAFDAVVASHLIEHLHDSEAFIAECSRVLKPNGTMIIVTPNFESLLKNRIFLKMAFVAGSAICFCLSVASPGDYIRRLTDFSKARRAGKGTVRAHFQEEHVHEFTSDELETLLNKKGLKIQLTRFSGLHIFLYALVLNDLFGRVFYMVSSKAESWQSPRLRGIAYDMTFVTTKG